MVRVWGQYSGAAVCLLIILQINGAAETSLSTTQTTTQGTTTVTETTTDLYTSTTTTSSSTLTVPSSTTQTPSVTTTNAATSTATQTTTPSTQTILTSTTTQGTTTVTETTTDLSTSTTTTSSSTLTTPSSTTQPPSVNTTTAATSTTTQTTTQGTTTVTETTTDPYISTTTTSSSTLTAPSSTTQSPSGINITSPPGGIGSILVSEKATTFITLAGVSDNDAAVLSFRMIDEAPPGYFDINLDTGVVSLVNGVTLDHESGITVFVLKFEISDNSATILSATGTLTIEIWDEYEAPFYADVPPCITVSSEIAAGTIIGTYAAVLEEDISGSIVYYESSGASEFDYDVVTGILTKSSTPFDTAIQSQYTLQLIVYEIPVFSQATATLVVVVDHSCSGSVLQEPCTSDDDCTPHNAYSHCDVADTLLCVCDVGYSDISGVCSANDCYDAPEIPNGRRINGVATKFGSSAVYVCDAGYDISEIDRIMCQANGSWETPAPNCTIKDCSDAPLVLNGRRIDGGDTTFGSSATYECDVGYDISEKVSIMCKADGFWETPAPNCTIKDCYNAPEVPNGRRINGEATTFNSNATYECDDGYDMSEIDTITCQADGTWESPSPNCTIKDCFVAPEILNGRRVNDEATTFRSNASYECDDGYDISEIDSVMCQADGSWETPTPNCTIRDCYDAPEIPYGRRTNGEATTFGFNATYECDDGYDISETDSIMCQADGSWETSTPNCTIRDCSDAPQIPNGRRINGVVTTFGSNATYECDNGYDISQTDSIVCQANGSWETPSPNCTIRDCFDAPEIPNGRRINGEATTFGSNATYECDDGYDISEIDSIMCQADGSWETATPNCTIRDCSDAPDIKNGRRINGEATTFGSNATYECDDGYDISVMDSIMCLPNRSWETPPPNCTIKDCFDAPEIENGRKIDGEATTFGSNTTYECDNGYDISETDSIMCQADGSWESPTPNCTIRDCSKAPMIPNGRRINGEATSYGSNATYECDDGYDISDTDSIMCLVNGSWETATPNCTIRDCLDAPEIPNGRRINSEATTFGSNATYKCDDGYDISEIDSIICQANGSWETTTPNCTIRDCYDAPDIPNGRKIQADVTTFGSNATYECDDGFDISETDGIMCQADGSWETPTPNCTIRDCYGAPDIPNGRRIDIGSTTFGSNATYECDDGYDISETDTIVCLVNGSWETPPPNCTIRDCFDAPEILNGRRIKGDATTFGSNATYQCDYGYALSVKDSITCQADGFWETPTPNCTIRDCSDAPEILNGRRINDEATTYGSNATYECDEGYDISGLDTLICQADGSWETPFPNCTIRDCYDAPDIENGRRINDKDTTFGSNATYKCDDGYDISEIDSIMCQADGSWETSTPNCTIKDCFDAPEIPNGKRIDGEATIFGSNATYECEDGYVSEIHSIICQANGLWETPAPNCTIPDCFDAPVILNGRRINGEATLYRSNATYECNDGYDISEKDSIMCQADGSWETPFPDCTIRDCSDAPDISNGRRINDEVTTFGSNATYECDDGYDISLINSIMCQANGSWEAPSPNCTIRDCFDAPFIENGRRINSEATTFGSNATYECDDGYDLSEIKSIMCQADGLWESPSPSCTIRDCSDAPDIPNGRRINGEGTTFGFNATYECDDGYDISIINHIMCQADGSWEIPGPNCTIRDCYDAPEIPNGRRINGESTTFGSSAIYECNDGYGISETESIICQSNASWEAPTPNCTIKDCFDAPEIPNGRKINGGATVYRSNATYECDDGYDISEMETIMCQADGLWETPTPNCIIRDCFDPPETPNGRRINGVATTFGSNATYECDDGYDISEIDSIMCQANGSWETPFPMCTIKDCYDAPEIPNGRRINGESTKYGSNAIYECNDGYGISEKDSIICQANASWEAPTPNCTIKDCFEAPEIPNGRRINGEATVYRSNATYECDKGYDISEIDSIMCQADGLWETPTPNCTIRDCSDAPEVPNGKRINGEATTYGSYATYQCDDGYDISEIYSIICQANASWETPSPTCTIKDCSDAPVIANGRRINDEATTFGSNATYECDNGYTSTTDTITCQADGSWETPTPNCTIQDCSDAPEIPNGRRINGEATTFGSNATYECDDGYDISEIDRVMCQADGFWESPSPNCTIRDCSDAPEIPHGRRIDGDATTFGSNATYECDDGYDISVTDSIMCQVDASWEIQTPNCTIRDCFDAPEIPNGGIIKMEATTFGSNATYVCDNGYDISEKDSIMCRANGSWETPTPNCTIRDCFDAPEILNGRTIDVEGTTFRSNATYECDDGYDISETDSIMCQADGSWETPTPNCTIRNCSNAPEIPNGRRISADGTTFGSTTTYECDGGYDISEVDSIMCQADGSWETPTPNCTLRDCSNAPEVPNGRRINGDATTFGSNATYECDDGYDISEIDSIMCQADASWETPTPNCTIRDCLDAPEIDYGRRIHGEGTTYGSNATYECDDGYDISEIDSIMCQADGSWETTTPNCTIRDCLSPPDIAHGRRKNGEATTFGSTAEYECDAGFGISVIKSILCQPDGTWETQLPNCTAIGLGDSCAANIDCTTHNFNSQCDTGETGICICAEGYRILNGVCTQYVPLFNFGDSFGDQSLQDLDDECSDAIQLTNIWIPIYGNFNRKMFICTNGLVSFGEKYTNPSPPRNNSKLGDRTLLAPFYADGRLIEDGRIFFRWADDSNSATLQSTDTKRAEELIRKAYGIETFSAKFIFVGTWYRVRQFKSKALSDEHATFQLVLLTNGADTFVLYVYGRDMMKWSLPASERPKVWIGFNAKGGYGGTNINSFQKEAFTIDRHVETKGMFGILKFRLTPVGVGPSSDAIFCLDWYKANKARQNEFNETLQKMPECPCSLDRLVFDPWYMELETSTYPNTECVKIWAASIFRPHGKTCCYDTETGLWIADHPRAGGYIDYHPFNDPVQHHTQDEKAKTSCCNTSNLCDLYYLLRPVGKCYPETWFEFGTLWGDPHFRTLDGKTFIFNGLGEYTMLTVATEKANFTAQARTERAVIQKENENSRLSFATIFSAFAAWDHDDARIHVELNKAKTGINVYGNDIDLTTQYYAVNTDGAPFKHQADEGNLLMTRRGNTLMALLPASGISLNISLGIQMLTVKLVVPKAYKSQTTGLLGNFDGIPSNDFILPNGTVLQENITERMIFDYASEWSIDDKSSVFRYPDGLGHADFSNDSYIPKFLDDVDNTTYTDAVLQCGSEEFLPCIFDLIFTENPEVAEDTKETNDTVVKTKEDVENDIPMISGCETLVVELGKDVECNINVEDDGTELEILFLVGNASIERFDGSEKGVIKYTQVDINPVVLSITVKDKQGKQAPPVQVNFIMCTSCHGRGNCSDTEFRDGAPNEKFKYQKCICEPYYQGDDCEDDFDGCATEPCSHERTCTDLGVEDHKALQKAYNCSSCEELGGYFEDGGKCIDVNECDEHNGECDQICENTDGSYECSCNKGYRLSSGDKRTCEDINECDEASHDCQQVCNNLPGSFNCSCLDGFSFNAEKDLCEQVSDPCESTGLNCSMTDGCTNSTGTPTCVCPTGFQLTEQGNSCQDVNECLQNVCPQGCINNDGGFECTCWTGYHPSLVDPNSCEVCQFPFWGDNCENICTCTGPGSVRCDPVHGCICDSFWAGVKCDVDINECEEDPNICGDPYKICENAEGSYSCNCISGFENSDINDPQSTCKDIDECRTPDLNSCTQKCVNAIGGYSCDCFDGFSLDDQNTCKDINECNSSISGCQHLCENKPGFFNCYCYFGFILNDDRKTCEKAKDPCKTFSDLQCQDICIVDDTTARCECSEGFTLAADQQSCIDVKECSDEKTNLCDHKELCTNTNGSFTCACRKGWKLQNDRRSCKACDEFHYGLNCASKCDCAVGAERCDPEDGCQCHPGWTGDKCELDKDECSINPCTEPYTVCRNFPGSYTCECKSGYQMNSSGLCKDIDECSEVTRNDCDQICSNSVGSYTCSCRTGFIMDNHTCIDIDECLGENDCQYSCSNTLGGYRCSCPVGFRLVLTDRRSCIPADQCPNEDIDNCAKGNAECYMQQDTPTCNCKKGFKPLLGSPENCTDVLECNRTETPPCEQICTELVGSFQCSCKRGFKLDTDGRTCAECRDWTYAEECSKNCSCNTETTSSCDAINGTCYCMNGWTGESCDEDINECMNNSLYACPNNSVCENSNGSYTCKCDKGYFKTGDGKCSECTRWWYGLDCDLQCTCKTTNTEKCNNVDGNCSCYSGWTGDHCEVDIDECKKKVDPVCTKNNTECSNTPGSYQCDCLEGYYDVDGQCRDVLECLEGTADCNQTCSDISGGYMCSCYKGYEGYWNDCTVCSDNRYGQNCSDECNCTTGHTESEDQMCDTVNGTCYCKEGWRGMRCEVDIDECEQNDICDNFQNTGCVNLQGNFSCDCLRGYILENEQCVADPDPDVPVIGPGKVTVAMVIVLQIPLPPKLNLAVSSVYEVIKARIEAMLREVYRQTITVTNLRFGSLIVSYNVTMTNEETLLADVATTTLKIVQGALTLQYDGQDVNVTSITVSDQTLTPESSPCEVFRVAGGQCDPGEVCSETDEQPACRPVKVQDTFVLVIGLCVGGMLFLIIIGLAILCMRLLRRKKNEEKMGERSRRRVLSNVDMPSESKPADDGHIHFSEYLAGSEQYGFMYDQYLTWKSKATKMFDQGSKFQISRPIFSPSAFSDEHLEQL